MGKLSKLKGAIDQAVSAVRQTAAERELEDIFRSAKSKGAVAEYSDDLIAPGTGGIRDQIARYNETILGDDFRKSFDNIGYHGTDQDVENFDPRRFGYSTGANSAGKGAWMVDNPDIAAGYADYAASDAKVQRIIAAADRAERKGKWADYDSLITEAENLEDSWRKGGADARNMGQNVMPLSRAGRYYEYDAGGSSYFELEDEVNDIIKQAKAQGYDGVTFNNLDDAAGRVDMPANHTLVFDPKNLRSVNAAFDPAKKDSANLMASVGGAAVLGGAALSPEDAEAGVFRKAIDAGVNLAKRSTDDYSSGHIAPYRDEEGFHSSLDDVTNMFGDDIYSKRAKQFYGGDPAENESIDIIQRFRGKPDEMVDIYRAVPENVSEFNQGDWVSLSEKYAREHGDSYIDGYYNLLKGKAKASDLFNEGYTTEWGIDVLAKKYGISAAMAGAVLAGTMTPEQAQASTKLSDFAQRRAAKQDHWKQLKNTILEGMAAINRGAVEGLNFIGPDQVNAVMQLSGSDKRIPTFSDIPGVEQATEGNFMEPGTARDVVRTGGEFFSPL